MGVLLFILSNVLGLVLLPVGIVYGIVVSFYRHHFNTGIKGADHKFLVLATSFDKYGNAVCAELFNACLIQKESKHPFGNIRQTISQVLGHNLKKGTLTKSGKTVVKVLDFFEKDHVLKAIQKEQ